MVRNSKLSKYTTHHITIHCGSIQVEKVLMQHFQQKSSQNASAPKSNAHFSEKSKKCALLFGAEVFLNVPWDVYRHCNSAPHLEWVAQQCCQVVHPALDQRVSGSPSCGAASRLLPTQTEVGAGSSLQDSRVRVELQNSSNLCHQAGHCLKSRRTMHTDFNAWTT